MAARLTKRVTENHRKSIQVSMLINRLFDHIVKGKDMKPSQVDAAKYLISQAIGTPSSSSELTGKDGAALFPEAIRLLGVDTGSESTE